MKTEWIKPEEVNCESNCYCWVYAKPRLLIKKPRLYLALWLYMTEEFKDIHFDSVIDQDRIIAVMLLPKPKPPETINRITCCGWCKYDEADGSLIEQCENCKLSDKVKV